MWKYKLAKAIKGKKLEDLHYLASRLAKELQWSRQYKSCERIATDQGNRAEGSERNPYIHGTVEWILWVPKFVSWKSISQGDSIWRWGIWGN